LACTTNEPADVVLTPRPNVDLAAGASLEELLVADLQNPSSKVYTDEAAHRALLAKAFEEVPGLKEKIETVSKTLAASYGVTDSNPRLVTTNPGTLSVKDLGAGAPLAKPAGARCAAAVGFGAAYAYAWACRQCASGETVCASAYAYAYAWAFAWVCASEPDCGTQPGTDGGVDGGNDGGPSADAASDGPLATDATADVVVDGAPLLDAAPLDGSEVDAKANDPDSGNHGDAGGV